MLSLSEVKIAFGTGNKTAHIVKLQTEWLCFS